MLEFASGNSLGKRKLSCRLAELIAASIVNRGDISKKGACVSEGLGCWGTSDGHTEPHHQGRNDFTCRGGRLPRGSGACEGSRWLG